MSLSGSLSNALSGLTAASRAAQLVSTNVSNAMTEGFARRELELSARTVAGAGAGVRIDGVSRAVDDALIRDRRMAEAELGYAEGRAAFLERMSALMGDPMDAASLSGRVAAFEAALIEATSRPDSDARLAAVLDAAGALTRALNGASDGIALARQEADAGIASEVGALNAGLRAVQDLNAQISRLNGAGRDVTALLDERQRAIDAVSRIVPVREMPRDDGKVALVSAGGAVLLDPTAVEVAFAPTPTITADMTLAGGALSGLRIDGRDVAATGAYAPLGGGSLAALFDQRDALGPEAQARVDALARDLVERLADPAVDPTLAPGAPGLLTDAGAALAPALETGLAGRIAVNALADPASGGALWRLRDGLGAAAPGAAGDASTLRALADALAAPRAPASGPVSAVQRSAAELAGDLSSLAAGDAVRAVSDAGFAAAALSGLREAEGRFGVDTDQELQKLLLIEEAYAANARVVQTIDRLIGELLGI